MRRFVTPLPEAAGSLEITGELFHHMARVLRLKMGTRVILADGGGRECLAIVSQVARESITVTLEESRPAQAPETGPRITLFQGLPRADKLDLILQKATELGAAEIVPFPATRSVARFPAGRLPEKVERWERIVREAARQSGRATVPEVNFADDLGEVLRRAGDAVRLILWEEEQAGTLKKALAGQPPPASIAVIVGPEGGLTAEEVALAVAAGFVPVSLGRRIVRTETAGPAILAILQFHWGDIG
jgi:16S rRNA (uracil1498-N3)-methyltransferase